MTIFRNKGNGRLYTIEHVIHEWHFFNANGFSGIYATPYKWNGEPIRYILEDFRSVLRMDLFDPLKFVEDNFERVATA